MSYCFKEVEKKWQRFWDKHKTYAFVDDTNKEKFYILDMFPYPSGSGLHVGHIKGYLSTDIYARYKRMKGFCVLHPIGWDAFGLPAEQYAIKHGKDPREFTLKNIENFKAQLKELCFSYDFDLDINTCDPEYYAQTQWIFSELYKKGMAELSWTYVNWCPQLNTALANEEILVENGKRISERGGFPVQHKKLQQWLLKITKYSDRLLNDIDVLEWNDNIKKIQQNWIGKQDKYQFKILIDKKECLINLNEKSDIYRLTGVHVHAFSSVFVSDQKDVDVTKFVDKEKLKIRAQKMNNIEIPVYFLSDVDFRSDDLLPILDEKMDMDFKKDDLYECVKVTTYKLKDWVFSRQRYWGEPFPVYYNQKKEIFLDEKLPVILPTWNDKEAFDKWYKIDENHYRDINTMPNWAGSSWYFLAYILRVSGTKNRYLKLDSKEAKEKINRWMPVDIYVGGQEHANLHLLYARFWYKFLYDCNVVHNTEPFKKLINQGMILAEDGSKMSKSKNNSVNTTDIFEQFGSDVLRLNMAFMGPTEFSQPWEDKQLVPFKKWIEKIYYFFNNLSCLKDVGDHDFQLSSALKKLIKNAENAVEKFKLNVLVSELMIFFNTINELKKYNQTSLKTFIKILSFLAPAIAEEIWFNILKEKESVYFAEWPNIKTTNVETRAEIQIQINNVFKQTLLIDTTKSREKIIEYVLAHSDVQKLLQKKTVQNTIFVPQRMINIIVK